MKKKLFIFSNESISIEDDKFFCDNLDLKSTPEGLNKKFEVNSDLIPNEGRTIQCGSCNHTWFFNKSSLNQDSSIKHSIADRDEKNKQENQKVKYFQGSILCPLQ